MLTSNHYRNGSDEIAGLGSRGAAEYLGPCDRMRVPRADKPVVVGSSSTWFP